MKKGKNNTGRKQTSNNMKQGRKQSKKIDLIS